MAEYPGDATQEDIEKKALRELKAQLVGVTGDRQVTVDATTAALLVEKLPSDEELEETEEEKERLKPKLQMAAAAPVATAAAAAPVETRAELEAKTKEELLEQAHKLKLDVAQSWTKAEIIDAIEDK